MILCLALFRAMRNKNWTI